MSENSKKMRLPGKERESPGVDDAPAAGGIGTRGPASAVPTAVRSAVARHAVAVESVSTTRATATTVRATANEGQKP